MQPGSNFPHAWSYYVEYLLIERDHLKALLEDALNGDITGTTVNTAHAIAAQHALASSPLNPKPSSADVRGFFEDACRSSRAYRFPLGHMVVNGKFQRFFDSDTDSAFVGYRAGFIRGVNWERQQRRSAELPTMAAAVVAEEPSSGG
jgi:hypothetical protein